MEALKALEQVSAPDERSRYFRGMSLERLHSLASEMTLNGAVPEPVHNQFAIARNAYLYSWFYYPFQAAALLYSFLAVELALHHRVKQANPAMFAGDREPSLYRLLECALRERWILDTSFRDIPPNPGISEAIAKRYPSIADDQRYSYNLLDVLVSLRNGLAHGEFMIAPSMGSLLFRAVEIINQLFPDSTKPSAV